MIKSWNLEANHIYPIQRNKETNHQIKKSKWMKIFLN